LARAFTDSTPQQCAGVTLFEGGEEGVPFGFGKCKVPAGRLDSA